MEHVPSHFAEVWQFAKFIWSEASTASAVTVVALAVLAAFFLVAFFIKGIGDVNRIPN